MTCSTSYLGAFESDLWSRLIPQFSFQEDFARHAVIALGALNKAARTSPVASLPLNSIKTEKSSLKHGSRSYIKEHHDNALKHYGKTLTLLQRQYDNLHLEQRSVQNTLVACLLLCSFENAQGGVKSVLRLTQAGVKIISEFEKDRQEHNLVSASIASSTIDSELLEMFLQFESSFYVIEAKPANSPESSYRHSDDTMALENMPSQFASLKQARKYLNLIHRQSLFMDRRSSLPPTLRGHLDGAKEELPQGYNDWYHQSMLNWDTSFGPLLKKCRLDSSNTRDLKATTYLKMKQLIIDLDRPDSLYSFYWDTTVLQLCMEIATLASQLLDSKDEVLTRGPSMPRYDILLEEVVSPLLRAADKYASPLIREISKDLLQRFGTFERMDLVNRA